MPIKVACACGAAFAAKDELAGRTVACPKCKQPLKIQAPQAAPAPIHSNAGLFDDIGLKARDSNIPRCPACGADMPPNAVLCVKCGYNVKLGKRMQTISMSGDSPAAVGGGGHGAHGDATAQIMAKAAKDAEDDAQVEISKGNEGMPLWVLCVGLGACVLFALVMSMIPQTTALSGTGSLLIFAAGLMQFYSWINVIITATKINPLYGIGIFFGEIANSVAMIGLFVLVVWLTESPFAGIPFLFLVGVVWLVFAYIHSDECGQFITIYWASFGVQFAGRVFLTIGELVAAAAKDGSALPAPPILPTKPQAIASMLLREPIEWPLLTRDLLS